jgi:hypothetical protein
VGFQRSYGEGEVFLVGNYQLSFTFIVDSRLIPFAKANITFQLA